MYQNSLDFSFYSLHFKTLFVGFILFGHFLALAAKLEMKSADVRGKERVDAWLNKGLVALLLVLTILYRLYPPSPPILQGGPSCYCQRWTWCLPWSRKSLSNQIPLLPSQIVWEIHRTNYMGWKLLRLTSKTTQENCWTMPSSCYRTSQGFCEPQP